MCIRDSLQTLLGKHLGRFLGDIDVRHRKEVGQRFEDSHFRAQTAPDAAHLKADDAGSDDGELLRYLSLIHI